MNISDLLKKYDIATPRCGAFCGDGWVPLIESLIVDLIALGWDKRLAQVKEKLGSLRFYVDDFQLSQATQEAIHLRIQEAEDRSCFLCETCGEPGKLQGNYWLKTGCAKCSGIKEKTEKDVNHEKQ